jgi:TRAP-type C4-dicarboxylate transport system permease small subunit
MGGARVALRRLDGAVAGIERAAAVALLAAAVVVVLLQVFFRHVLNSSFSWAEEAARYLFVWASLLGFSSVVEARGLFGFELVYARLVPRARLACRLLFALAVLGFLWALVVGGLQLAVQAASQRSPAMGLPMALPYAALPLGGLGTALHFLRILVVADERERA